MIKINNFLKMFNFNFDSLFDTKLFSYFKLRRKFTYDSLEVWFILINVLKIEPVEPGIRQITDLIQ